MTTTRYAEHTEVPVERSKRHIEELLTKHGAEGYHTCWQAATAQDPGWDAIEFLWKGKQIRFRLSRMSTQERTRNRLSEQKAAQRDRQRWRVLFLVVKAKIEAVNAGVAVFEEEFMSFIVVPGRNQTIGEIMLPRLKEGSFDLSRALPAGSAGVDG